MENTRIHANLQGVLAQNRLDIAAILGSINPLEKNFISPLD